MRVNEILVIANFLAVLASPSLAHHPGADLDKLMGSKEKFFQAKDKPAPGFSLRDAAGRSVRLADLRGKVVILNFIYTKCPDVCPLHAEKIADVQSMVNQTPTKQQVQFLTVTTDPKSDTFEVLREYGPAHGLDPVNWTFLTTTSDQPVDRTRGLAKAYGHKFIKVEGGYQVHGVVTHIIDIDGRWAANFHGLRFAPLNMVLYINGLTNNVRAPKGPTEINLWDRVKRMF